MTPAQQAQLNHLSAEVARTLAAWQADTTNAAKREAYRTALAAYNAYKAKVS